MVGGVATIFTFGVIGLFLFTQVDTMINYDNDSISEYLTGGDMITVFNASQLDSVPMYNPSYMGKNLPRFSNTTCSEFDGDCLMFA